MSDLRILVIDNDPKNIRLLDALLSSAGYAVLIQKKVADAINTILSGMPDLVIIHKLIANPGLPQFISNVRKIVNIPVIVLSNDASIANILSCFNAGADDFLQIPFRNKELLVRILALLKRYRRTGDEQEISSIECGELLVDVKKYRILINGTEVYVTPKEFNLIYELAKNADKVLTHEYLLKEVWGNSFQNETDYLRSFIHSIRKKLEPDPANPRIIITVYGVGYVMVSSTKEENKTHVE
jgi:two-component system KDP operon response regulator KdpE